MGDRAADRPGSKDARTFDKKAYRFKKYSNKYKLNKWENDRRKTVLKSYYKELRSDPQAGKYTPFNFDQASAKIGSDCDDTSDVETNAVEKTVHYVMHPDLIDKKSNDKSEDKGKETKTFWKVKAEMKRLKEEKVKEKEAFVRAKEEREKALGKYKVKKAEKFKMLSRKSKSGQPLMKDRMQMLLESIQATQ